MDVKVARFRCKHPKCAGNSPQKNDFSIQTIYEHVAQHLDEDTGSKDHYNLGCSCDGKYKFSLLPYATCHLNQFRKEPRKHNIVCKNITPNDVLSSRRILCYQKRFVEFKEFKIEKDDCPDLTVYPVDTVDVPQYNPFMMPGVNMVMPNGMPIANFNMFGSGNGARSAVRSSSPVAVRTPVFSGTPGQDDYSPPPYNSRKSPKPSGGKRSPPSGPKGLTPAFDSQRRDSGRCENRGSSRGGYRGGGGVSVGFGREDGQSRNSNFHGRGRGNYRGRGGFGRDSEGFNGDTGHSTSRNHEKRAREAASPRSSGDEATVKRNAHGTKSLVSNERENHNSIFGGRGMGHNGGASTNVPFNARGVAVDTRSSEIRPRAYSSPRSSADD